MGVRTLPEALLSILIKGVHSVYTKIRSERVTFFTVRLSEFHRREIVSCLRNTDEEDDCCLCSSAINVWGPCCSVWSRVCASTHASNTCTGGGGTAELAVGLSPRLRNLLPFAGVRPGRTSWACLIGKSKGARPQSGNAAVAALDDRPSSVPQQCTVLHARMPATRHPRHRSRTPSPHIAATACSHRLAAAVPCGTAAHATPGKAGEKRGSKAEIREGGGRTRRLRLRPPGLASQYQAKGPHRPLEPTPTTRIASARSPASLGLARANDMEPRAWKPPGLTAPKNGLPLAAAPRHPHPAKSALRVSSLVAYTVAGL
jgi:hypothetical protein